MKIEPLPESTPHARSFAAPCQNRGVAPARCRIGLVQHEGERHLRLGTARFGSRGPPQDRRDRSAAAEKGKPRAPRVAIELEAGRLAVMRVEGFDGPILQEVTQWRSHAAAFAATSSIAT